MPDAAPCVTLTAALLDKIDEQIERTRHLIGLVPAEHSGLEAAGRRLDDG